MVKGIIFDLDGVLLSTDEYHYQAWKAIADELGIYFDKTINNKLRGVSRMDSLDIILGGKYYSPLDKQRFAEKKNNIYRELLNDLSPSVVSDDVRSTLIALRALGIKTAIGSSSKNTKFILQKVELIDMFDAISDGTNIIRSKPDPEVFLKAAEFINLNPSECIVVEDAYSGIEAAKAGDFTAAAIGDAQSHPKADYKISRLSDLLKIVK
ncbi:MAG: beta-phosphoglucomutase [Clostridiales bacterium]|nr:beta-phosphoglucomutase [Clostridiales bacterium]